MLVGLGFQETMSPSLTNNEIFPLKAYNISTLKDAFLEYHVRAISTEKGLKILSNILKK